MSRNAIIVFVVVLAAAVAFAYITFRPGAASNPTQTETPTPLTGTPGPGADLATLGATLYTQYRCNVCHTTNGERAAGPTMKGLYGSSVKLTNGQTVIANTDYLTESIANPDTKIVSGYGPDVMSAALADFTNQINQGNTIAALVAYIESLK
jgi:cytochrome c oxidase subunit 2